MKQIFTKVLICICTLTASTGFGQSLSGREEDLQRKLQEIQQAINEKGVNWSAERTDIFELPLETQRQMCGSNDTITEQRISDTEDIMGCAWHPETFDWRNKDGNNWMTPVRNQGACGSCVAFGTIGTLEGQLNIYHNDPRLDMDLSEQHIFSCGGGTCDQGWWPDAAFRYLLDTGVPDEECFPYTSGQIGLDQPCRNTCPDWRARVVKISCWGYVGGDAEVKTPAEIKEQLLKGPIATTMMVYEDFSAYSGGIYEHVYGEQLGGHCVAFVGWDDTTTPPCWIVRNSWGMWGEGGYFRIRMGSNEVGIESRNLYLMLGEVPKGRLTDNGYIYGKVELGESKDWRSTIINEGLADLEIYGFSGRLPDFYVSFPNTFPQTLAPTESLDVTVTFAPDTLGFRYDKVKVLSNSCRPFPNLRLRGTGIIHTVMVTPTSIEQILTDGGMKTLPITVMYTGDSTLTFTVTLLREWLTVEPDSGTIEAGGSSSFKVTLDPSSLLPGVYNTNVLIYTDSPHDPVVVVPVRLHVENTMVTLTLPSTVRPTDETIDLSLAIDNETHVHIPLTEVSIELGFDAALLELEAVWPTRRTEIMSSFLWSVSDPGELILSISDINGNTIPPGTGAVAEMTFVVKGGIICEDTTWLETGEVTFTDTTGSLVDVRIEGGPLAFLCRGDVNIDGAVNVLDVLAVINHTLNKDLLQEEELYRADCSGDHDISVVDALGIVNVILHRGTCEP